MLKNYLKATFSKLLKRGSYSFLNIGGLVLGMSSCILIMLYVLDELSFDQWIPDAKAVYRFETIGTDPSGVERLTRKSALRARRDLLEYFGEIEAAARVIDQPVTLSDGDQQFRETVWFTDPDVLDVFGLEVLSGDPAALLDKSSLLISAAMAKKYFGDDSPLGRVLTLDKTHEYRVAGVYEDIPQRSHVRFDFIAPYDENDPVFNFGYDENWSSVEGYTYVRLAAGVAPGALDARLAEFRQTYPNPSTIAGNPVPVIPPRHRLLNVLDIHLDPGGIGNIEQPGSKQMLVALSLIALTVLVIATINFVNLSTVQSLDRAKEVSVRKAIGAQRKQLITQFLSESVLTSTLALFISMSLIEILLPAYNAMLGRNIDLQYFSLLPVVLLILAILLGIISGLLPAYRLAASQPATVLRSGCVGGKRNRTWLQAILVTSQFAISATLVITTLVVFLQQVFIANKDIGFVPEGKLVIRDLNEGFTENSRNLLADTIAVLPGVLGTTFSAATPGDLVGAAFYRQMVVPGNGEQALQLYPKAVGADFFKVYGTPLLGGREFSNTRDADRFSWSSVSDDPNARLVQASAVINATAMTTAGFAGADEALGSVIRMANVEFTIIGVVPDTNFQSLRNAVTPNIYIFHPEDFPSMTVSYSDAVAEENLVDEITAIWKDRFAGAPLTIEFVENNIRAQYRQDRLQFQLISICCGLAISIACCGLYALTSYSTRQRTREIGIRKVHGAFSSDILAIFLAQFSKPVVIAVMLSWPVAWYAMDQYLRGFEYRIELEAGIFVVAGIATIAVACAAIVVHVLKAANGKAVDALRHV